MRSGCSAWVSYLQNSSSFRLGELDISQDKVIDHGNAMTTLYFYFDYVSNNAYLAWSQLQALSRKYGIVVEPRPILFAGLLNAHGNVGPAEIPAKRDWMLKNILRKSALLDVPMSPPRHHPFNPLMALRASCMPMEAEARWRLIDGFFQAVWVSGLHISDLAVVQDIARQAGLDDAEVCEWSQSAEAASVLRQQTDEAVSSGVFGIPSMLIDGELFFGYDDFPFLELYLQGADPLDRAALAGWTQAQMSPSSRHGSR